MSWPTDNISTASVDSQADRPDRRAFLTVFRALKAVIGAKGRPNGLAELDGNRKIFVDQLRRNEAGGVAPLNSDRKVPVANLPGDIAGVPVGAILPYCGGGIALNLDWDWAHCDGRWMSKSDFPLLWRRIANRFLDGATARATQFRVPDLRGHMLVGASSHRGVATRAGGAKGGAESTRLTAAHMPEHRHHVTGGGYHDDTRSTAIRGSNSIAIAQTHGSEGDRYFLRGRNAEPTVGRTSAAGAARPTAVPTMPPFVVIEWIVRTR